MVRLTNVIPERIIFVSRGITVQCDPHKRMNCTTKEVSKKKRS